MALAILTYDGSTGNNCCFTVDTGTNAFYKYTIGKSKTVKSGLDFTDEISYESELLRPQEPGVFESSFALEIPSALIKRNGKYIQLTSYKNAAGRSPAFSEVVVVFDVVEELKMPGNEVSFSASVNNSKRTPFQTCRTVSLNYRKAPLTRTAFWQTIIAGAKEVEWANLKGRRISAGKVNSIRSIAQKATEKLRQHALSESVAGRNMFQHSFSAGIPAGHKNIYSPTLSRLLGLTLQQSPQLVQTDIDNPYKLLNAIVERQIGNRQFAYNYFEKLQDDKGRLAILNELRSYGASIQVDRPGAVQFSPSQDLSVSLVLENPVDVLGKPKIIYQASQGINLLLEVKTALPGMEMIIPKVIVQLTVKDSISMQLLLEKTIKLRDVNITEKIQLPVTKEELDACPRNKDILVGVNFIWQSNKPAGNKGTFNNGFIFLSDGYILKEIGAAIAVEKPLNDMVANVNFWHKLWEGGGNNKRWELELDTKYTCIYKYNADTNGRIEPRIKADEAAGTDESRLKIIGKMKAGLEVSPVELNSMLPIMGNYPVLTTEQLKALRNDELEKQMNQEANVRIELKGKKDERGVLWAYPEITLHPVLLKRLAGVNENGQVTGAVEEKVFFPRVSSFHFVGAKTT